MANMSYCRFENTVDDMKECLEDIIEASEDGLSFDQFTAQLSTDSERYAVKRMLGLLEYMTMAFEQLQENEGLSEEKLENLNNDD